MPELEYFVVAESISTDRERNTVSLFHVVEEFRPRFPAVIPKLVAVSSWRVSPEEIGRDFQVTLEIQLPGQQSLPSDVGDLTVNFTAQSTGHRIYHTVKALSINAAGDAIFRILMNGKHVASRVIALRESEETA